MRVLPVGTLLALHLMACGRDKIISTIPPDVIIDSYSQLAAAKVDVLWVVDNSESMKVRQENLANNFSSFINVFQQSATDFRMAVTTTDVTKQKGAFVGTTKILKPTTPNFLAAFQANVKVGIDGSPYETGLHAAELAIEKVKKDSATEFEKYEKCRSACVSLGCTDACARNTNVDFLRPDAYLYIVIVSDEDDEDGADVRYYWRYFKTAKGIGNDSTVNTAMIVGDFPQNSCNATPGARYHKLTQLTGGDLGSICDQEFADTLKRLATSAIGLKRKFSLSKDPNVDTFKVTLKFPCNTTGEALKYCTTTKSEACQSAEPSEQFIECTPAKGGENGWSYEASSKSIYFAGTSMPYLNAKIEVQYYLEGTKP